MTAPSPRPHGETAIARVGERLGSGGELITDDTGFIGKGAASPGAGRQYAGTSGKTGSCQLGPRVRVQAVADACEAQLVGAGERETARRSTEQT
ncbi:MULTISPECIES: transposase [unclassified Streptomyces]|uniref:transposase n=1 Tax=unclassified Streptomyces TaxID=2593676 RepID=UPI00381D3D73